MLVRTRPHSFCCLTQHHHAQVAGLLAKQWPAQHFLGLARREEVLLAIREHDRGWISLDTRPIWNDQGQVPYSFINYPTALKLRHYQQGIEEVAALSPYAGLLCSLHYSCFQNLTSSTAGIAFLHQEAQRQQRLRQQLNLLKPAQQADLSFHLRLLKFCDGLSLYLCLSDPSAAAAHGHPTYEACVPGREGHQPKLSASWLDGQTVQLSHSPFEQPFAVPLYYVELPKATIQAHGLAACYALAPTYEQVVQLTPCRQALLAQAAS